MAVETPQYRLADRILNGCLDEILAGYREAGHKPEHVSRLLFSEHGLQVSRQTLVRWMAALPDIGPIDDEPEAATG